MKTSILEKFARWVAGNRLKALLITLVVTAVMIFGASKVRMEMSFISIFPENTQKFKDLKTATNEFPIASSITVILDSKGIKSDQRARELLIKTAEELNSALKDSPYVSGILDKNDLDLIKNHGLILSETKDIKRFREIYKSPGLIPLISGMNDDFEKEYSGNEDNLKDDEARASYQFKSLESILELLNSAVEGDQPGLKDIDMALDNYLYGEEYFFNKDSHQLILYILPSFSVDDVNLVIDGVNEIEETSIRIAEANGIEAGLTGFMTVSRDEMVTSTNGFLLSMLLAVILILSILIIILKMKSVPIIIGIPLLIGIIWTTGITGFFVGRLNLVSSMYMVALFGLGVDYAIHILTNFTIERESGKSYIDALAITYRETGKGVITGALTTAVAFFALLASETTLLKELGFIAGLGIICVLFSTLLVIPLLLTYRELNKKGKVNKGMIKASIAESLGHKISSGYKIIIGITLILVTSAIFKSGDVKVMDNLMEMEAKGLTSVRLQDEMVEEFEMSADPLMVITDSIEEARDLSDKLEKLSTVKSVDSIATYLTTDSEYLERSRTLKEFRTHLKDRDLPQLDSELLLMELYRLEANLLEISEMSYLGGMLKLTNNLNEVTGVDNNNQKYKESVFDKLFKNLEEGNFNLESVEKFQRNFDKTISEKLLKMSNPERVTQEMLPEIFTKAFISRDGDKFLLNITPTRNPWISDFRKIYQNQIETVTDRATGMVMVSDILTNMTSVDGVRSSTLALIIVFILLIIDFRNIKLALMTILPLIFSFMTLFAIMAITGIKLDFVNIVAIPLLIGIGIDDAIHINHRYLLEGAGNMNRVIKHAGSAVLLTSITTTIGFASFIPSPMVGLSNSGIVFSLAIILAFTFSILFYPSLLIVVREKLKLNINSWKRRNK